MDLSFSKIEKKILNFWKKNKTFEESIRQRAKARNFVFYEGPPTANARPGIHHVLARVFKDIICRYKTMRGFKVLRKAGWDTHGLPVELEIEKKLGFKSKKDIEKYGIARFNKKCKELTLGNIRDFERLTERIGFWLDMENPYITSGPDYMETLWWIIKQIYKKGLLYQDYKVLPYCSRCGTSLSSHEVAQGYERIKEPAIYVRFKIKDQSTKNFSARPSPQQVVGSGLRFKNTYLLVWTTTPWTLPGNVAVAVNPEFIYAKIKVDNEFLILAKERLNVLNGDYEIVREFKGKDLVGLRYKSLYPFNEKVVKRAYRVIPADFVSLEEGTGLVHIAPAFGEEDMAVGKKNNLPILLTVDEEGKFKLEVKKWAGLFVKKADPKISEDLKNRNLLFKEELYEHDYPFCWRCHTPLLYYAKKSWFIKMTEVKKALIKNNQKINWIPERLKEGRFGEWLRAIKDWAISRERYWGTPLSVWRCQTGNFQFSISNFQTNSKRCNHIEVIGSLEDLLSRKFSTNNYYLLRHGHSLRQVKNLVMCWPEKIYCPLTKKGVEETKAAARRLKGKNIDLIFSSDLLRTKQSAEIISKETGVKIIFDKRLREADSGVFNGKNPKLAWEYIKKSKNPILTKLPGGENFLLLKKRMIGVLKDINEKYQDKNILIISHELPLTILEYSLKGWSLEKIMEYRREKKIKRIETGKFRKTEFKNLPLNKKMELDFHRPYIDEMKFYCPKCKGIMERVPEVIDCWFDSGAMPFGQAHWPFAWPQTKNEKLKAKNLKLRPPKLFPADYISEGVDQTRGWFYTLLAISTLLGFGPPYKNVISLGHVLDENGEKMSKSKGNVVDPWYIVEKYGADATRWYFYTINQPGDSKLFSKQQVEQALKKFIMTLWNCYVFYNTYAEQRRTIRRTTQKNISVDQRLNQRKSAVLLDRWIVSKLNRLILEATDYLDKHDVTSAARAIENFVIDDLSLWYIRRSRRRFHPPNFSSKTWADKKTRKDFEEASQTLGFVLLTLSKLTAPFAPFLSEQIYRNLKSKILNLKSVHLEDWPKVNKKLIDKKLEKKMEKVREIVALALAERAKAAIRVRQPLLRLKIKDLRLKLNKELLNLIKEEVNVKEIIFSPEIKKDVELDIQITPELKEEGIVREVIRNIQEMRKIAGLKPKDKILVNYFGPDELNKILEKNKHFILKEGKIKNLVPKEEQKEVFAAEKTVTVDQQNLWLGINRAHN